MLCLPSEKQLGDKDMAKKKRYDAVILGIIAVIGFSIVVMKLSGYWPCDIINTISGTYLC
jgi:hypothetical protein